MKTKKWMCFVAALSVMMASSSCQDWGEADPPAAGQIYPKLENVAEYTFDDEELDPMQFKTGIYDNGEIPSIADDETKGKVLSLNKGYVSLNNPMKQVSVQNGVSLTFWMKQNIAVDPETEETLPQDLTGALIAFENENASSSFFMTANGWLNYSGIDGEWSENNPAEYKTGYITPGEWHYVALIMRNDGYGLYVDGERKVEKKVDNFDCSKIVDFMSNVSTLYIGYGSETVTEPWKLDDLKLYRNLLTEKEIQRPRLPGEGAGPGGIDFSAFDYCTETPALTVGLEDCSGGWWTHFSNYYRIPADANMRISFTNHTSGGGNWNNWNLCICTDADRGADGYAEYFVIRSDLYGWGDAYGTGTLTGTGGYEAGDWDKFRADMEGAEVVIDIKRQGEMVVMTATATCPDGTVYVEKFETACGDGTQIIRAFLITDGSYLEIHKEGVQAFWPVEINTATVGATDNSTGWWVAFSDYFTINPNMNLNLQLTNHTSGVGNWNNWCACVSTDAERGGDGYAEYFVVRSDLFGWGDAYNAANWTSSGYDDWDKFRVDMEGADVNIKIERAGNKITYTSKAVAATDGSVYNESIWAECGDGTQVVRTFLIVDGSHFVLNPAQCYTYVPVYK